MLRLVPAYCAATLLAGALSGPAFAQSSPTPAAQPPAQNARPIDSKNEVVCQKQEVTGSRLGWKRICKTRAEWADAQLQDRQEVNRVQTQRGNAGD
jgi:hypothetical protein